MKTAIIKIEKSNQKPRHNWGLAFKEMNVANDDRLLLPVIFPNRIKIHKWKIK